MKSSVSALKAPAGIPFELSCPAQGSPIPAFRSVSQILTLTEPVGSSAPKFTLKRDGERRGVMSGSPFDMSCPAQGSPVPAFRLVLPTFLITEPVGGSAPKFSSDAKTSGIDRAAMHSLSLACPAQGSPVPAYRYFSLGDHPQSLLGGLRQSSQWKAGLLI